MDIRMNATAAAANGGDGREATEAAAAKGIFSDRKCALYVPTANERSMDIKLISLTSAIACNVC